MALRTEAEQPSLPGDVLVVIHEFHARSPDELTLGRGDRIELVERDDDFGDGWFLGKNLRTGESGLFPEVYTRAAPKTTVTTNLHQRSPSQPAEPPSPPAHTAEPSLRESVLKASVMPQALDVTPPPGNAEPQPDLHTTPLQIPTSNASPQTTTANRSSLPATASRSLNAALSGGMGGDSPSAVMHETLSVIDEHITDMSTPRHSITGKDLRPNDSGSEYSSHHRLSYINGHETEEEEHNLHTEEEVMTWSPARVAEYLEDVGVEKRHCDIFREQEINGEVLLGIDQATIFLKEFELGPVGPRLRTWLKIKALQQEVKTLKEDARVISQYEPPPQDAVEPSRHRATSMGAVPPRIPSLRESQGGKTGHPRQPLPRTGSTTSHAPLPLADVSPHVHHVTPASPSHESRPSAASVRSLNHNRRHSSIDYALNQPAPGSAGPGTSPAIAQTTHRKIPSFDRNWSMSAAQRAAHDIRRPSSSSHMHTASTDGAAFDLGGRNVDVDGPNGADLDRGYFSGNEVDNRKARNVLRKRDSPAHSRNPSYSTDATRRAAHNRRHSRLGSSDSNADSLSPVSPAARAYYGSSVKSHRASSAFDFIRSSKHTGDLSPTVTKLEYNDSPSIDAIAASPNAPPSEASSSVGRASPSPAVSHSFFGKRSRGTGLRAISDAITGGEKAHASAADITESPIKESPMQSPTRTGSNTPSAPSVTSKSLDMENPEKAKRHASAASSTSRRKSSKHQTSAYLRGREPITPQQAMVGCDYSGWMKKKSSSLMTTWKSRLFVLRGRRLSYFYSEDDTEEKGLIDISSHRVLPANNERITGLHAAITRAGSHPSSPNNPTIPTTAANDAASSVVEEETSGMFIFKLVPPRAGLQKGVQFTKPIVHYFAVDNLQQGRLWMAALMKATIDRDDSAPTSTTYQQKTISLEKARAMRQRPPALMDDADDEDSKHSKKSKGSIQDSVIHEEDEKQGLAISGLDDAKALLDYAENGDEHQQRPQSPAPARGAKEEKKEGKIGSLRKASISPVNGDVQISA